MPIRYANMEDVDAIDKVFGHKNNRDYLGFVMKLMIKDSIEKESLVVYENEDNEITGAVRFNPSKVLGYLTLNEIATIQHGEGIGQQLVDALLVYNMDIRLKVTADNENAIKFYEKYGFYLAAKEKGRKRELLVYIYKNSKQRKLF